jgi:poly[(R)-3-hydroxyalkanoate] polymerase subunit PhaC
MTRAGAPGSTQERQSDSLSDQAADNTLALNPLIGLRGKDLTDSAAILMKAIVNEPIVASGQWLSFLGELGKIGAGQSERGQQPGDKRFADATWKNSAAHRGLLQVYLAWGDALNGFIDKTSLSDIDKTRARLIANIFIDAASPTNNPISNPAAVRQFLDTGGASLWRGFKNYLADLAENGGLPAQVDKSPFKLGVNIATTPGAVVFRNEVLEVIQYKADTPEVRKRPLIITPPQINKFYSVDLSPDKSLVQYLLKNGIQVFCVSWRNPTAKERDWGLDTYVEALDEGTDAVRDVTASDDVTMMGACSGGITSAAYAGWLAAKGEEKIKNIVSPVCVLDTASGSDSAFGSLVTPETLRAAKENSRLRGVLDGQDLARVFAWMRPNDLIWNYWVNNYLLGNQPPAFDILYWNGDTTSLPARLHHNYVDMYATNPFVNANKLTLNGLPLDMRRVKVDAYVAAGVTDHITPWKGVYKTAKIYGDKTMFVLSNSGHLQSLLNPPTNPKASFAAGTAEAPDADTFSATAEKKSGSWWPHWRDWLFERSGAEVRAPATLGNNRHPAGAAAPGTYVFE